ncbi:nucleotidyltransferase family protein [Mycobacterium riyadhense]|uniref:Carbon monoxide dehydrogenase n=1 Tax=Mycobacterium riyadhense TaxID=486698 RepID=A0A1X2CEA9_9MYCO|nr:nucleotidyltransferase family protein [Mycobacterium riyadhense]MCV7144798.1 nucleotidyltransferase family protein [Mycobacterium riyadhense]ORW74365.1 carbon monoxide dehydrogenase [Mycobacterium riyadhense]VTO99256.1 Nicotine blue oxidoreductase [Mycobacterium riyadhense]
MTARRVTGVVLAAGGSSRLGIPKQLLPYGNTTLLGATLDVARSAGFHQLIVTLGGAAQAVRNQVRLGGVDVVSVEDFGTGCSASLRAALERVGRQSAGIVLMLGDQPGVGSATLRRMINEGPPNDIMVCRYADGIGHPFWFNRNVFDDISQLHGDKGVWKLIASGRRLVSELAVDGPVPLDVDTWDDYRRLLESVS